MSNDTDIDRRIRITFETVTPESAEEGECSDSGWIDEDGVSMEPDDFDIEDEISAVNKAIDYLRDNGVSPSSSHFHSGVWYTEDDSDIDYQTGEETRRSYHLVDFSEVEEREIFDALKGT